MVATSSNGNMAQETSSDICFDRWVSKNDFVISDEVKCLFEWFVLGTPAIGVSKRSEGFIKYISITTTLDAESLFSYLTDNEKIEITVFDASSDLESAVKAKEMVRSEFWEEGEFVYFVRTENEEANKQIKELEEYRSAEQSALMHEQTSIIKRRFFNIDALFRHMRNALAHGCFVEFDRQGSVSYFMFDINQYGKLSATISISFSRLRSWHNQIERLSHLSRN